jgi:hypothetical protein
MVTYQNRIERAWLQHRGWLKVVEDLVWDTLDDDLRNDLIHYAETEDEDF